MNTALSFTNQQYGIAKWKFYDNIISRLRCHENDQHSQLFPLEESEYDPPIFACKFAENQYHETLLALANEDGKLSIHDTSNKEERFGVRAHNNAIFDVTWMFDHMKIVTASGDHTAKLFDICSHEIREVKTFYGHSRSVKAVAFRKQDPSVFASGGRDGNIIIWDTRTDTNSFVGKEDRKISNSHNSKSTPTKVRRRLSGASSPTVSNNLTSVTGLVFQDDNTLISCGSCDGMIKLWDLRKNYQHSKHEPMPKHRIPYAGSKKNGFSYLTIDQNCIKLYANCLDNTIYCYNLSSYSTEPIMQYEGHKNSTFYIKSSLSKDGCYLISGSSDENAYIWNTKRRKPLVKLSGHTAEVTCVAWCQKEDLTLVTCSDDMSHKIWRVSTEEVPENWEVVGRGQSEILPLNSPVKTTLKRKTDEVVTDDKVFIQACQRCTTPTTGTKCIKCSSSKRKCLEEIQNDMKRARELEPRRLFNVPEEDKSPVKLENLPNFVIDGLMPHLSVSPLKKKDPDWLTKLRIERKFKLDMDCASTSAASPPKIAKTLKKQAQSPILRYFKIRCEGHSAKNCGNTVLISTPQSSQ